MKEISGEGFEHWPLLSGRWAPLADGPGFCLTQSSLGHAPSTAVSAGDLSVWLQAGVASGLDGELHPPEFSHCSRTGAPLKRLRSGAADLPWVPPFGASALGNRPGRGSRGLRQSGSDLAISRREQRRADADPDAELALPPPGDYEFFSIVAASQIPVLLALDPLKGMLYTWLPHSQRWEVLEHVDGGLLAVSRLDRSAWRCEVGSSGTQSLLVLPTEDGLACLRPDVVGLGFDVQYVGEGAAVGAPVQFGEHVWAPLRRKDGGLRFLSVSAQGESGATVDLAVTDPGNLQAPVADGRMALWLSHAGQLVLRKRANGQMEASFIPWPAGLQPGFEFGSPFLSRDGSLWQLCFDSASEAYVYLQLGVEQAERQATTAPRLCSGAYNFRFGTKFASAPWLEPEHGDDSAIDEVVLPLLESPSSATVLGVKLSTTAGLADVLCSAERVRVELVLDDNTAQTSFYSLSVAEPWRLRFFVHDRRLWAYHPLLNRLAGWSLNA